MLCGRYGAGDFVGQKIFLHFRSRGMLWCFIPGRGDSNVPKFSSLQQLTVAIKEAGRRGDWMGAIQLLEGGAYHNKLSPQPLRLTRLPLAQVVVRAVI